MKKIKNLIVLYPSFERGGATANLINFVNACDKKKIKIYLITNITKNDQNFLAGLNVHKGNITYKAVADVFGHKYLSPSEAIA